MNIIVYSHITQCEHIVNVEKVESTDQQMESVIQVQKVLRTFDPDDRYLLLLVELEGMSYRETAEMLKTTEDAIRSKLHRLRQEFVKKLK